MPFFEDKIKPLIEQLIYTIVYTPVFIHRCYLTLFNKLNKISKYRTFGILRILGNGESLNEILDSMRNEDCDYMVVNRYVLSESYIQIRPRYYVLADPHFFSNQEGLNIIKKIIDKTTWNMLLFIPAYNYYNTPINRSTDKKNIEIVPYNTSDFNGFLFIKKILYNHNLAIPKVQNVIVACIYIGICMKYEQIELYGVEHSWTKYLSVNENNEVCLVNPHFFDKEKVVKKTWKEIQNREANIHEALRMYADMFESYLELQEFATLNQVKILNRTKDSFIDAFARL